MSDWPEVILRDICWNVQYGHTASASKAEVGPKFLRITDIVPALIDWEAVPYCELSEKDRQKYLLKEGDIVVARTGATTGWAKRIKNPPEAIFASYLVRLQLRKGVDPSFVGAVVESAAYKEFIQRHMGGAAQPNANAQVLTSFPLKLPPLPIQRKIAAILSAYDDLIENNTRRVQVLEEMARALYREWFVEFRFPGHETAEFVEDEQGRRPKGWDWVKFTDAVLVMSGGTPKTTESSYWGGDIPFYSPKDSPDSFYVNATEKTLTEDGLQKCNSRLYPKDTVFITARGTVGNLALAAGDMAMNQSCYALDSRAVFGQHFLFLMTERLVEGLQKQATGAVFDAITVATFQKVQVLRPSADLVSAFGAQVQPLFEASLKLTLKNANLRRTRDMLLPRLVSGELDVSALNVRGPGLETEEEQEREEAVA